MKQSDEYVEFYNLVDLAVMVALLPADVEATPTNIAALNDASNVMKPLNLNFRNEGWVTDVDGVVANHRIVINYEAFGVHQDLMSDERIDLLKERGIEQLVFTGVTMEVCVQSTMREANDRGYDCLLITDGAESYFPKFKETTINMIVAQGGIVGWACDSSTLLEAMA